MSQAFYGLKNQLLPLYDEQEAAAIAHELLMHITGMGKMERLMQKDQVLNPAQLDQYDAGTNDLISGRPLQYVIGKAWFMGMEFGVDAHVLIPRPETEELVQWVVDDWKDREEEVNIIDIGTGSGCIPISIRCLLPMAKVSSCDISSGALGVARQNAERLRALVELMELDFLNEGKRNKLGQYHVIVSNPPYIPQAEQERLHRNVSEHEPWLALFVPDNDALVFYKAIALFGKEHLKPGGAIYCEIESSLGEACRDLFVKEGYEAELRKDLHGNWRMIKAVPRA